MTDRTIQLTAANCIDDLLAAVRSFEEREQCDVQIMLYGDGSGTVMAPELFTKDSQGESAWEGIQDFDSIEGLGTFLAVGHVEEAELRGAGL